MNEKGFEANQTSVEADLRKTMRSLSERVKELNCIYAINNLFSDKGASREQTLRRVASIIPPAYQYPEVACARINLPGIGEFSSPNFLGTIWNMSSGIRVNGIRVGSVDVHYLEERPHSDEGPFLAEERRLLDAIANLIGHYVEEHQALEELKTYQARFAPGGLDATDPLACPPGRLRTDMLIDVLMKTDPHKLLRITRKMMYHIYRNYDVDFGTLLEGSATGHDTARSEWLGINMPNPRKSLEALQKVQSEVFEIAGRKMNQVEVSDLINLWLKQDKVRPFLMATQDRSLPLSDVKGVVSQLLDIPDSEISLSPEDEVTMRTGLIRRLFTDRLDYINVAKQYMTLKDFGNITRHMVGPAKGEGKLGGKVSGLLLAKKILRKEMERDPLLEGINFAKSWYLTSDAIMDFIQYNAMDDIVHVKYLEPEEIRQEYPFLEQVFKNAAFPPEIIENLRMVLRDFGETPIIVRSSSLLEDNFGAAFSGKYKSLFLANTGSEDGRLDALMDAVAEVYASILAPDPIEYRRERGLLDFNEEMGVLIQEVVGTKVGPYHMPAFAGVAFSNNEFRWSPRIRREDGIIRIVAGLGTRAVDRVGNDYPILVSPHRPEIRVNTLVEETIQYSQRYMDVINVEMGTLETVQVDSVMKAHGDMYPMLANVVSIVKDGNLLPPAGIILDPRGADMVVTFEGLFEKTNFLTQMKRVLAILKRSMGHPVDVEFAHDGRNLFILQCRPQSQSALVERIPIPERIPSGRKLFSTSKYVTTGHLEGIEYIVYVDPTAYDALATREEMLSVARAVGELNQRLPRRRFILMGPGRWGSRGDIKLGVQVQYRDIHNTALLVEIAKAKGGYMPELSFGTHFFQDLVEANIHYLPLYPDTDGNIFNESLVMGFENSLKEICPHFLAIEEVVRVIRVSDISQGGTMSVVMDGDAGKALAFLVPPDHTLWRLRKVDEIVSALDPALFGVHALYLIGSVREHKAGPGSDIDLLVHFRGTPEQRVALVEWMEKWSVNIERENRARTGIESGGLLDVHIITDDDIHARTSWAVHINAIDGAAKELRIKKPEMEDTGGD